ncbi:tetratricopeptide repeat protein [Streptomyces albipurpureus]|uniref:Tetratricopeptide repeat protein n=1 Tax=Streptomyces albipurpureus TaxID=2897419 RepID=A0ABT0UHC6_9ACTN|nr:tetratricopeptide repeat protein [Streptomyces sp. CWNU-1]MCM2387721.1 tetratricopeptide repeat protein [Streptomyces sp. CWNU-1]
MTTISERNVRLAEAVRVREQGDAAEARRRLLALGERWPQDAEIAYQTAWAHDALGLEAEAVPFYERALTAASQRLTPGDRCEALLGLGSTYRVLGRYEDAERTLRTAVAEYPEHGALQAFLAMTLFNRGQYEESTRLLLELLAATSEDPTVRAFHRAIEMYAKDLDGTAG